MSQDGLVLLDKPAGLTSHDVVGRVRRALGTRKVGHAGTLDPMATGVLVLGVGRATRLLGHLSGHDKDYDATIRLGVTTVTDDADGDEVARADASGVSAADLEAAVATLTGDLLQVPSAVSAVKVDGVRSYARVRSGEAVELTARPVRVSRFTVLDVRRDDAAGVVDLDVSVTVSSGTYVRALARDLGAALGVGGHLTALRRTRSGPVAVGACRTLAEFEESPSVLALADALAATFPRLDLEAAEAVAVGVGRSLPTQAHPDAPDGPLGVFGPDGTALALMQRAGDALRPLVVFVG